MNSVALLRLQCPPNDDEAQEEGMITTANDGMASSTDSRAEKSINDSW
jgi:hypothetical protein